MKAFLPGTFSILASIGLLLATPPVSVAARRDRDAVVAAALREDPVSTEFVAMLGSAVPERTAVDLASRLRVLSEAGADAPLHSRLASTGSPSSPRFEASGLSLTVRTLTYGDVRVNGARVVLSPSTDGASCRFELTGIPFGGASTLEASGTVEWGKGPFGGHRLEGTLRLGNAAVEAVRALLPGRIDPSIGGPISLVFKADGIVGETTTEEAPATPLRGELEWKAAWTVLGRSAPLTVTSGFSLDDRMMRLLGGHLKWMEFDLPVKGWFEPPPWGRFDLSASFADIDTRKVAEDWSVPEAWRPVSTLSGSFTWKGKVGDSLLRYEAAAPQIDLQGLDGWSLRLTEAKLQGGILEVNADVSASISGRSLRIGELQLPRVLGGLQWWRQSFRALTQKTPLWKGTHTASLLWTPADHPAFSLSGTLTAAEAPSMMAVLLPGLGLDVDGDASMSYSFGQDAARTPKWTVHGSLMAGRLGNIDFLSRFFDALAAADPALALPEAATLVPPPRVGKGTRVDRLFFEVEKRGEGFELGGVLLDIGDYAFEGDGRWSPAAGLVLDGTVALPATVIGKLVAAAPWMAALRSPGGTMIVPVTVRGTTSAPVLALGAAFADGIARARRGEAVSPPAPRETRHVGVEGIPPIAGDPARFGYE